MKGKQNDFRGWNANEWLEKTWVSVGTELLISIEESK